jgi:hypothetical protein
MPRKLAESKPSESLSHDRGPDLLSRAREIGPKLGVATDELNESLTGAEEAIASLKLGVTASVTLEELEEEIAPGLERITCLTFGKEGSAWRLLIERGVVGEPETWKTTPLVSASRETRLLATKHLRELLKKLIEVAEAHVEEVRVQAADVNDFIASIKRGSVK